MIARVGATQGEGRGGALRGGRELGVLALGPRAGGVRGRHRAGLGGHHRVEGQLGGDLLQMLPLDGAFDLCIFDSFNAPRPRHLDLADVVVALAHSEAAGGRICGAAGHEAVTADALVFDAGLPDKVGVVEAAGAATAAEEVATDTEAAGAGA